MNKKILAFMPLYKWMEAPAVQSLTQLFFDTVHAGDHFHIVYTQGMNVALARNEMFKFATSDKANSPDYILTLDSDHIYKSETMYRLIEEMDKSGLNNLAAPYRVRGGNFYSMIRYGKNITEETLGKGIQECDCYGFGFNIFKPALIKEMQEKFGQLFVMDGTNYTGEDFYFCQLVREAKYKCNYLAEARIGHLATVIM